MLSEQMEDSLVRRAHRVARDYAPVKVTPSTSMPTVHPSTKVRSNQKAYDRAFNAWAKSKPGTPEAVKLLRTWINMPTC